MPTISKLASGAWRAQVRRKGRYAADTFRRRKDAETGLAIVQGVAA